MLSIDQQKELLSALAAAMTAVAHTAIVIDIDTIGAFPAVCHTPRGDQTIPLWAKGTLRGHIYHSLPPQDGDAFDKLNRLAGFVEQILRDGPPSKSPAAHDDAFVNFIGNSQEVQTIKDKAYRVAQTNSTVLITGETGTGKGLLARSIHLAGQRRGGPYIEVNCGAIPESLMESELFGYERGAFTGALREGKPGKFEMAHTGTIFLDEIGEMSLRLQVELLHVLQSRRIERVSGTQQIPVDIRILAASNQDLEQMMAENRFRKDLYFRLGVIPLHIPPVRERREDLPALIDFCLQKYATRPVTLADDAKHCLTAYDWPGNVREIENTLEYAVNMCEDSVLTVSHLPSRIRKVRRESKPTAATYDEIIRNYEKDLFISYLNEYGHTTEAKGKIAAALGISRATLYRKLSFLQLTGKN